MASSPTPVRVMLIGLPPNHSLIPVHVHPLIAKGLEDVHVQMADAGIQYEFYPLVPEEGLAALATQLKSQRLDAVIIGNGIRSNMDLTPIMEQAIDVVRTSAPQAKLLFNTRPDNTVDAVKRWFPIATKSA